MSFEKSLRIPTDRVGVLIGKSGNIKSEIEKKCSVKIHVDSETGDIRINEKGKVEDIKPFKAVEIITAIGRGFSPKNAILLLNGENALHVIDLRDFAGKSTSKLERIKGRIIGEGGKARQHMEELSGARISVYGRSVGIIGETNQLKLAINAITDLCCGRVHGAVYSKLEAARRREKRDKLQLWEGQNIFD